MKEEGTISKHQFEGPTPHHDRNYMPQNISRSFHSAQEMNKHNYYNKMKRKFNEYNHFPSRDKRLRAELISSSSSHIGHESTQNIFLKKSELLSAMALTSLAHSSPQTNNIHNRWICDICNTASFETYEEACRHEIDCARLNRKIFDSTLPSREENMIEQPGKVESRRDEASVSTDRERFNQNCTRDDYIEKIDRDSRTNVIGESSDEWRSGSIPLAVPTTDRQWLSELNCFVREKCVEAFSATLEDVQRVSKRGRVSLHQVGIRCVFCSHKPIELRAPGAVSYASSLSGIYDSVKRWQRVHLSECQCIPSKFRETIEKLQESTDGVHASRQYWVDSAITLGMIDTPRGIRFKNISNLIIDAQVKPAKVIALQGIQEKTTLDFESKKQSFGRLPSSNPKFIVFPDDEKKVPSYVYFLLRQVELCHFSEADMFIARSKGKIGFSGFKCRHCFGHAGLGKYFPSSSKSLSTNSTSQNLHSHLMKCRVCPPEVKQKLKELKAIKTDATKFASGWRRAFFGEVWARLRQADANIEKNC